MAEAEKTQPQQKTNWERGKDALERIMKYISVEKLEKLATKVESKEFRSGYQYKIFINTI